MSQQFYSPIYLPKRNEKKYSPHPHHYVPVTYTWRHSFHGNPLALPAWESGKVTLLCSCPPVLIPQTDLQPWSRPFAGSSPSLSDSIPSRELCRSSPTAFFPHPMPLSQPPTHRRTLYLEACWTSRPGNQTIFTLLPILHLQFPSLIPSPECSRLHSGDCLSSLLPIPGDLSDLHRKTPFPPSYEPC